MKRYHVTNSNLQEFTRKAAITADFGDPQKQETEAIVDPEMKTLDIEETTQKREDSQEEEEITQEKEEVTPEKGDIKMIEAVNNTEITTMVTTQIRQKQRRLKTQNQLSKKQSF